MDNPQPKTTKRTYWFPDDIIERFEALIPPEKRDEVMNQIIKIWLEEQRIAELRSRIIEGLNDADNEALSIEVDREWAPLSDEVWSQIDDDWSNTSAEAMRMEFDVS